MLIKKVISKLVNDNIRITKTKDILSTTKEFYQNIYKSNENVIDNTPFLIILI